MLKYRQENVQILTETSASNAMYFSQAKLFLSSSGTSWPPLPQGNLIWVSADDVQTKMAVDTHQPERISR